MVSIINSPSLSSLVPTLGAGIEGLPQLELDAESEYVNWLRFDRLWGQLGDRALQDIARSLHLFKVEAGTIIYQADQPVIGLYLMKWGAVEIYRISSIGSLAITDIENLAEALLDFKGMADLEIWLDAVAKV